MDDCFMLTSTYPRYKVEPVESRPRFFKPRYKRHNLFDPREEPVFPFWLDGIGETPYIVYASDYSEFMTMREVLVMVIKLMSFMAK